MRKILATLFLLSFSVPSLASNCVPIEEAKKIAKDHQGTWPKAALSHDQWEFLRGIYVLNPQTPPGMPYGDSAVLVSTPDPDLGMILFIDGKMACTPMQAPKQLLDVLKAIGSGKIFHEGTGL